jgi:hypothetical protein
VLFRKAQIEHTRPGWTSSVALEQWRGALLVPEVVGGIHPPLHRGEPLEVAAEVLLAADLAAVERADVVHQGVLADFQVPVAHVRLPRPSRRPARRPRRCRWTGRTCA